MKLVTYSIARIRKTVADDSTLRKARIDTLIEMDRDLDEHSCFSKSNEEALRFGAWQLAIHQELEFRQIAKSLLQSGMVRR